MVDLILLHPPAQGRLGQVELPSDLPDAAVVPQAEPDRLLLERLGEPSSLPFAHEHPLAHSRAFFGVHETQARSGALRGALGGAVEEALTCIGGGG